MRQKIMLGVAGAIFVGLGSYFVFFRGGASADPRFEIGAGPAPGQAKIVNETRRKQDVAKPERQIRRTDDTRAPQRQEVTRTPTDTESEVKAVKVRQKKKTKKKPAPTSAWLWETPDLQKADRALLA